MLRVPKNSFNKKKFPIHFFIFKTYPSKYFFVITNHYFIVCDYAEGTKKVKLTTKKNVRNL